MVLGVPQPGNQYYLQHNVARFSLPQGAQMLPPYMQMPYMSMPQLNAQPGGEQKPFAGAVLGQGSGGVVTQTSSRGPHQGAGGPGGGGFSSSIPEATSLPGVQKGSVDTVKAANAESTRPSNECRSTTSPVHTAARQEGTKDYQLPVSADRKRKQRDDSGVSNGATNGTHSADATDAPPAKTQKLNGSGPASKDIEHEAGVNKDKNGEDFEDDPPLSDSDEDDADDPPNFLTAQYEKVSRIKNRWRCQLKYGIFHANGKDYLFKNATGDFTF